MLCWFLCFFSLEWTANEQMCGSGLKASTELMHTSVPGPKTNPFLPLFKRHFPPHCTYLPPLIWPHLLNQLTSCAYIYLYVQYKTTLWLQNVHWSCDTDCCFLVKMSAVCILTRVAYDIVGSAFVVWLLLLLLWALHTRSRTTTCAWTSRTEKKAVRDCKGTLNRLLVLFYVHSNCSFADNVLQQRRIANIKAWPYDHEQRETSTQRDNNLVSFYCNCNGS